jgi:hypothetical protein
MDAVREEERLVRSLLEPLDRVTPATLAGRRRSRRRRLLAYTVVAVGIIVSGVAVASSLNPLSGIGVAEHPQTPSDVLGPDVQAQLRSDEPPGGAFDQIGGRLVGSARRVGTFPTGRKIYVVSTKKGRLCVVVAGLAESCGYPLTQADPITFTTSWDRPGEPAYAYGVAIDGVKSVSFTAGGRYVTVPVEHNLIVYESEPLNSPAGFGAVTVTLADGTVQPVG